MVAKSMQQKQQKNRCREQIHWKKTREIKYKADQ